MTSIRLLNSLFFLFIITHSWIPAQANLEACINRLKEEALGKKSTDIFGRHPIVGIDFKTANSIKQFRVPAEDRFERYFLTTTNKKPHVFEYERYFEDKSSGIFLDHKVRIGFEEDSNGNKGDIQSYITVTEEYHIFEDSKLTQNPLTFQQPKLKQLETVIHRISLSNCPNDQKAVKPEKTTILKPLISPEDMPNEEFPESYCQLRKLLSKKLSLWNRSFHSMGHKAQLYDFDRLYGYPLGSLTAPYELIYDGNLSSKNVPIDNQLIKQELAKLRIKVYWDYNVPTFASSESNQDCTYERIYYEDDKENYWELIDQNTWLASEIFNSKIKPAAEQGILRQ